MKTFTPLQLQQPFQIITALDDPNKLFYNRLYNHASDYKTEIL